MKLLLSLLFLPYLHSLENLDEDSTDSFKKYKYAVLKNRKDFMKLKDSFTKKKRKIEYEEECHEQQPPNESNHSEANSNDEKMKA